MREVRAPRRLLLVSLDNLGDLAFCSALVPPLKRAFPEASVSVWAKRYAEGLLAFIPGLDATHACDPFWDRSPGEGPGGAAAFLSTWSEVRSRGYDSVLLPNTRWRTALAAWTAGIPRRVGFAQRGALPWLTDALAPERRDQPLVAEWARLLEPLRVSPPQMPVMHLEVPAALQAACKTLREGFAPGLIAGIHPFAGDERRAAPPEFWREVLGGLPALGVRTVLVVGRAQEAAGFIARMGQFEGLSVLPAATGGLSQALLAVSSCDVFVGNDSGPLHCAAGLGVPVLGLYLPGDWPRAMPQGRSAWRALRGDSPRAADPPSALSHIRELLKAAD